jgi:hypothetical protein
LVQVADLKLSGVSESLRLRLLGREAFLLRLEDLL